MANFFKTLDSAIQSSVKSEDLVALSLLEKLKLYLSDGKYSSYKRASEVINLNNVPIKDASIVLGITADTLKRARYSLSKEAWGIFGNDFFERLKLGDYDYCENLVSSVVGSSPSIDVLPRGLHELLVSVGESSGVFEYIGDLDLDDCSRELEFLLTISEPYIRAVSSNLDISKLLRLANAVNGSSGETLLQNRIIDYILSKSGEVL